MTNSRALAADKIYQHSYAVTMPALMASAPDTTNRPTAVAVSWHLTSPANSTKTYHADDGKDIHIRRRTAGLDSVRCAVSLDTAAATAQVALDY